MSAATGRPSRVEELAEHLADRTGPLDLARTPRRVIMPLVQQVRVRPDLADADHDQLGRARQREHRLAGCAGPSSTALSSMLSAKNGAGMK